MPVNLIASSGALHHHHDLTNSSRIVESHSYSQINMINKNGLVVKHQGSTSSSEERDRGGNAHFINIASEVSLKKHLRKRYQVGNHLSSNKESLKPHYQNHSKHELKLFSNNQQ